MDPNATMREIREIYASREAHADFERLSELIMELDIWLQRGGFPPDEWKSAWRKNESSEG